MSFTTQGFPERVRHDLTLSNDNLDMPKFTIRLTQSVSNH